ncbi:MAG: hypothetical protein AMXMBFR13_49990 [Phycisphaerae bacterium]
MGSAGGRIIHLAQAHSTQHPGPAGMDYWHQAWSRLGLWLTFRDAAGEPLATTGATHPFWDLLLGQSVRFRESLRHLARKGCREEFFAEPIDSSGALLVCGAALGRRRNAASAVLGCSLSPLMRDEEAVARFCSRHQLDATIVRRLLTDMPVLDPDLFEIHGRILTSQMRSLHGEMRSQREVKDLSAHLGQVYEELNLIYRLSSGMTVSGRSVGHLQQLCSELVASTLVENVVVVLEPPPGTDKPATVVRAGPLQATAQQLSELYRQAVRRCGEHPPPLVFNDAGATPELAWAGAWLKHLAFYPLSRGERTFGGILVINRVDGQEFGSYEIQLVNALAERSTAHLETIRLYEDLEHLFLGMLHALVSSIDAKDPYTSGHSQRVAWLCQRLASLGGVPAEKCERVYLSGLLHDIGKIGVSESVLRKTGRLTPEEFAEMRRHPQIGAHILQGVPHVEDLIPGVLHHHERMDGHGYPDGLKGDEVPFLGRVIGLADSFDAMTTNRTYRKAQPVQIAVAEIRRCSGTQFDPGLTELLLGQDLAAVQEEMHRFARQPIASCGIQADCSCVGESI